MSSQYWRTVSSSDSIPGYKVFEGDLQKPDLDDRAYRILDLENGLRAIVIHDPSADKAAACLTIAVGSMHDPPDMPGLAHFCEHMLSKGSQPFPEENDFMSFINSNGGTRNAGTGATYADYWFSIGPSLLSQALPRLAAFFHSPLFTQSLTSREINAVDSEFRRNFQNDGRRVFQLNKNLSIPGHPWTKFGTGNLESLTDAARRAQQNGRLTSDLSESGEKDFIMCETRRRLVEWWEQEYCAGRMTLAVLGRESLDELTALSVPLFSLIPNRGLNPRPVFTDPIWSSSEKGSIVFVNTVKDYHAFSLSFVIPDQQPHYTAKPSEILAHFLGHEGPGSICAYLKKKGWLLDINAGLSNHNRSVQMFKVQGKLTREGYLHYREVILAIFNYISILRSSPLEAYHFAEISTMSAIRFRFKEKTQPHTYVSWLAYELSEPYPPEWVLSGSSLVRDWDERLVRETLAVLTPESVRVILEAQSHADEIIGQDVKWDVEKWYGTRYAVRRLDASLIEQANSPNQNANLFLPGPNPFIPINLTVNKIDVQEPAVFPMCIKRTEMTTLWHKKDDQFWVPKANVRVNIRSPIAYVTPRHALLTRLCVDLVEDALSEVTYDADLAGLSFSVNNHIEGIVVSVSGYNDKLAVLLQTVMEKLKTLVVDSDRLKVIKEQVKLEYENFYLGQPSNLSENFAAWNFMPTVWTPHDKLLELPTVFEYDVQRHKDDLFSKVSLEVLCNGNIDEEVAVGVVDSLEQCLATRALSPTSIHTNDRLSSLLVSANFIARETHANPDEPNCSLSYYCQFGDVTDVQLRATLALIAHAIREPCHSQLRTREQLGYVVASSQWAVAGSIGLGIKVQSLRAPWDVEARVDAFLEDFCGMLVGMSAVEFTAQKEGLVVKKLERAKNLREETARFWGHICSGYYEFVRNETDAAVIRTLSLGEVVDTFDTLVRPSSGSASRRKLSFQLISQQMREVPVLADGATLIGDESMFKASLACSPAAVPVMSEAFGAHRADWGKSKL
ncbi:Insulin-degrading enzyme [Grifola frondosa]|uniref:Insulin-degrading enzyme n=1 Tax=Grifola frondosa TaxID=5627 RepID=A0A1C7MT65_GRIFR|nr:Insulin-degrading enzyme [Grifola frondosa]